jgi:hypothetical protein
MINLHQLLHNRQNKAWDISLNKASTHIYTLHFAFCLRIWFCLQNCRRTPERTNITIIPRAVCTLANAHRFPRKHGQLTRCAQMRRNGELLRLLTATGMILYNTLLWLRVEASCLYEKLLRMVFLSTEMTLGSSNMTRADSR